MIFTESNVLIRETRINKVRNNAVQLGNRSIGKLEKCHLLEGGGQGVQAEGERLEVVDCDISQFQFSGVRSNEYCSLFATVGTNQCRSGTSITVIDSRISKCATGTLIDAKAKATITSACIRQCTTAVEVSDGGSVTVSTSQLLQNKCGVAVSVRFGTFLWHCLTASRLRVPVRTRRSVNVQCERMKWACVWRWRRPPNSRTATFERTPASVSMSRALRARAHQCWQIHSTFSKLVTRVLR